MTVNNVVPFPSSRARENTFDRWFVTLTYTKGNPRKFEFYIEELGELEEIVENGPTFTSLHSITVVYAGGGKQK